jgi:acyl-CoA thioesterase
LSNEQKWKTLKERANSCAYFQLLDIEALDLAHGYARVRMTAGEKLLQFQGMVHGGAVYSMADAAVAIATLTTCGPEEHAVTIEGKINYVAPVPAGGKVTAEARLVHRGRQTALGDVEVKGDDGRLVAKGLITYMVVRKREA